MNKKHILLYGVGLIFLGGTLLIPTALNNKEVPIENMENAEQTNRIKIDFKEKSSSDMREYYTNEGLEFIKKILPDSVSSDLALLNVGKQLTKELKDITFTTADNREVNLKDLKGKKIILDFALTTCSTCQKETTFLTKYDFEKEGIIFLHIFPRESTSDIKNMLKDTEGKFHSNSIVSSTGVNGFTFEDLNITNVPAKLFIDENGIVQYAFVGGINDEETLKLHLERAFDKDMPKMLDYLK